MNGLLTIQISRQRRLASVADTRARIRRAVAVGLAAGLAGGLAEIGWIGLFDLAGGVSSRAVASEIARTLGLEGIAGLSAVAMGVLIHMLAAALLGIALAGVLRLPRTRIASPSVEALAAVGFLAAVWGFNFHLLGPAVAPGFVALLPDSISLASKLLFGLSIAAVLLTERRLAERAAAAGFIGKPDNPAADAFMRGEPTR